MSLADASSNSWISLQVSVMCCSDLDTLYKKQGVFINTFSLAYKISLCEFYRVLRMDVILLNVSSSISSFLTHDLTYLYTRIHHDLNIVAPLVRYKSLNLVQCEWVIDCCLAPIQQFFSYIMARTSYLSMRWWSDPLCSRPTHWVGFL